MSKQKYLSDSRAIIAIQGLRMATKSDTRWSSGDGLREHFYLELDYKGMSKKVEYASREERDAMYANLALLLTTVAADRENTGG